MLWLGYFWIGSVHIEKNNSCKKKVNNASIVVKINMKWMCENHLRSKMTEPDTLMLHIFFYDKKKFLKSVTNKLMFRPSCNLFFTPKKMVNSTFSMLRNWFERDGPLVI